MPFPFSKEQKADLHHSLQRYFSENLDAELSEMQAGLLLGYIMEEIAPFAYNQGVEDAQRSMLRAAEELTGTCFQEPMTYWDAQRPGGGSGGGRVRRKPGR